MEIQKPIFKCCSYLLLLLCCCLPILLSAQLEQKRLQQSEQFTYFTDMLDHYKINHAVMNRRRDIYRPYSIMLPSSGARHTSPLFCRLEDKINEGNKLQCLFRLGSVSYVNYLERKGDHQRLMLEQMR